MPARLSSTKQYPWWSGLHKRNATLLYVGYIGWPGKMVADKMVADKMVRTKWYGQNGIRTKWYWTKWYGQNGMDKTV